MGTGESVLPFIFLLQTLHHVLPPRSSPTRGVLMVLFWQRGLRQCSDGHAVVARLGWNRINVDVLPVLEFGLRHRVDRVRYRHNLGYASRC